MHEIQLIGGYIISFSTFVGLSMIASGRLFGERFDRLILPGGALFMFGGLIGALLILIGEHA